MGKLDNICNPIFKYIEDMESILETRINTRKEIQDLIQDEFPPSHIMVFLESYYPLEELSR